jgi:VWFA-related protein
MVNWPTPLSAALVLGALLPAPGVSAQQPASVQAPVFRSGVELVVVEAGVVDKQGQPLRGLLPTDFVVTVDGRERRVVTAEFVDVAAAAVEDAPDTAPVSTNQGSDVGRQFIFVVDTNTLEPGEARRVTRAASRLFSRLSFADRSALVTLPLGRSMTFTWRHDRVVEALQESALSGGATTPWDLGTLTEAREIATRGEFALREIAERACSGVRSPAPAPSPGSTSGGAQGAPQGTTATPSDAGAPGTGRTNQCLQEIQAGARMTWNMARANSLSSLTALRQLLSTLRGVAGDKTIVLISGGWPLEDHEQTSVLRPVADDAAAARATLLTVYVPRSTVAASRRSSSPSSLGDRDLHLSPLETIANMTGGESFRADAAPEAMFDRLGRELAGYYRLGVEKNASDVNADARRMRVRVVGGDVSVRARETFDTTAYEDRNWPARLASALNSPVPATAVGLRVTSYLGADPQNPAYLRVVFAGEASRVQPGDAVMQLVVRDVDGRNVVVGDQQLGNQAGGVVPFAANVRVPPGSYVVRVAFMDGSGRVGSVDHRVEARPVSVGHISVTGPLLVNVPASQTADPHFDVEGLQQGERLAIEVRLASDGAPLTGIDVLFEVADSPDRPALIQQPARVSPVRDGSMLAQAVADVRALPPGEYLVRVKVKSGDEPLGEVRRAFAIREPVLR